MFGPKEAGIKAIIVNNHPETVSTDFDTSDRLYFEPLVYEDVMNIIEEERPEGVIVQFGGQTAINLAGPLYRAGVKILGTSMESIDRAEDRKRFDAMVEQLGIPRPPGRTVFHPDEAAAVAADIGYPVLVRPSYVLGGRAMEIVYSEEELLEYMQTAVKASPEHPVLVDKYLLGKEIEVDAICDGREVLIPGIMQHIERAGVHSGDSMAVFPAHDLSERIHAKVVDYTAATLELKVKASSTYNSLNMKMSFMFLRLTRVPAARCPLSAKSPVFRWSNWPPRSCWGKAWLSWATPAGCLKPRLSMR